MMYISVSDIVWPLAVLCMTFSASVVANFTHIKRWSGKVARGAFMLWLAASTIRVISLALGYPPEDYFFNLAIRPDFAAFRDIVDLFLVGLPAALFWSAVGISIGILVDQIYHDLSHYFALAMSQTRDMIRMVRGLPKQDPEEAELASAED